MRTRRFSRPLTIILEQQTFDEIRQITDEQEISMSEWIRTAIRRTLSDNTVTGERKS